MLRTGTPASRLTRRFLPQTPRGEVESVDVDCHSVEWNSHMQPLKILVTRQAQWRAITQHVRLSKFRADLGEIFQRADGTVHIDCGIGLRISGVLARDVVPRVAASSQYVSNFSQQLCALRIRKLAQFRTSHIAGVVKRRLQVETLRTRRREHGAVARIHQRRSISRASLPFPAEVTLKHLGIRSNSIFHCSSHDLSLLRGRRQMLLNPRHGPLCRYLFRQRARACIVRQNFAGALGAELGQQLVKANSAKTISIFVGAIAERDHPVGYAGEVRLLRLQAVEECLCIVGDITLSVGGGADQEGAAALKSAGVKAIHDADRHLMASRLQRLLHFLRHHFGCAGHGSDQDRDVECPCLCSSPQALLYVRLRKYNASTVSRKRDIVHVEENDAAEASAPSLPANAGDGLESDYLRLLGERVRETRARRGMTRKILAHDSGVSERYLAQLETGQGNVSILLLRQIAQALDTPLQALVFDGPEPPVDLVHTTEFLRRLPATELVEARRFLVEHFGGVDLYARRGRIALIGLRGAGKSTLGAMLADRLEVPFLELDRLIEQESGVSLSVIFDLYGQSGFRRLERRVLDQVIERYPRFVLATGGSLVSEPATFERLLTMCFTVWLRATPEEHMQRVIAQGDMRPMADNRESMSDLRRILDVREPLYRKADATIDTGGRSVEKSMGMLELAIREG